MCCISQRRLKSNMILGCFVMTPWFCVPLGKYVAFLMPNIVREYVKLLPEFHSGDVAHATQQGSFAQPPRNVGPQLGFCLRWQAAVN